MELAVRADGDEESMEPQVDRLLLAETALALANKQLAEANRKLAMVSYPPTASPPFGSRPLRTTSGRVGGVEAT